MSMSMSKKATDSRQAKVKGRRDTPRVVSRKELPTLEALDLDKVLGGVAAGESGAQLNS